MSDLGRDSSMEDILASIKRVIAEDARPLTAAPLRAHSEYDEPAEDADDILELDQPLAAEPPLVSPTAADASRSSLAALSALRNPSPPTVADGGPLEAVIRDMLRPMLKEWLDQRLPEIVETVVAREVARITGKH